jgi:hypothetical protein
MGIHAARSARERDDWHGDLDGALLNLETYFGDLPDVQVVLALEDPDRRSLMNELLVNRTQPLLARSARALADYAIEYGDEDHALVRAVRRIPAGQEWTISLATTPAIAQEIVSV